MAAGGAARRTPRTRKLVRISTHSMRGEFGALPDGALGERLRSGLAHVRGQCAAPKYVNCDAFQGRITASGLIMAVERRHRRYRPLVAGSSAARPDLT
jgi:hypothetical protein